MKKDDDALKREVLALRRRVDRLEKVLRRPQVVQVVLGEDFEDTPLDQRREALRSAILESLEIDGGN